MPEALRDILLPRTDEAVFLQWIIMIPVWLIAVVRTRKWARDYRHFVWGLIMVNLAWFAIRAAH